MLDRLQGSIVIAMWGDSVVHNFMPQYDISFRFESTAC